MKPNFSKSNLIPIIIQDAETLQVLMLGYMNQEAYELSLQTKMVHFFSRSKNRIWKKGESSGNVLNIQQINLDCDQDTFLILIKPAGPTCHTGNISYFGMRQSNSFVYKLESIIQNRIQEQSPNSYTYTLSQEGIPKIAQKVGEEAVEVVIEYMRNCDELFLNESADLLFHYLLLINSKNFILKDVEQILIKRNT